MELIVFQRLTKLKESFFGLPTVVAGALLASQKDSLKEVFRPLFWVLAILAFLCARVAGMAFNQLIDRHYDSKNKRTANRVLPTKQAQPKEVLILAFLSLFGFFFCCSLINFSCFLLSFPIAFLLIFYSFTKRFTPLCHFVLALIHLLGPVMGGLAIAGKFSLPAFFLGSAIFCLIAGNDILYALQDIEFDKGYLLYSLPAKLGFKASCRVAKGLHLGSALFLGIVGILIPNFFVAISLPLAASAILFFLQRKCLEQIQKGEVLGSYFFWSNASISLLALGIILVGSL